MLFSGSAAKCSNTLAKTDWQIAHALLLNCNYAYSRLKNLPTLLRAAGKNTQYAQLKQAGIGYF